MTTITETPVETRRGRPRLSRASSTKVDGPQAKTTTSNTDEPIQPNGELKIAERRGRGRPRLKARTTEEIAEGRNQERAKEKQEYKAEMQKYLKDRLKQGKAKVKLENSIKQLEAKMKAL
jgi:hypothetical protein